MTQSRNHSLPRKTSDGFTIVEMIVAVTVSTFMLVAIVGFIVTLIQQYGVSSQRNTLTTNLQAATSRINDDIRKSVAVLPTNQTDDPNGPSPTTRWSSKVDQLVLGQKPTLADGTLIDTEALDSVVYYLKERSLYRRVVAASTTPSNSISTITCGTTANGCPDDVKVAENVDSIAFTYRNNANAVISYSPNAVTNVSFAIKLTTEQSGQTIESSGKSSMTLRQQTLTYNRTPLSVGPGGLLVNKMNMNVQPNADLTVKGRINWGSAGAAAYIYTLGTASQPIRNLAVAGIACGTGSSFPTQCSSPTIISGAASKITTQNLCAPAHTGSLINPTIATSTNTAPTRTCDSAAYDLPAFNREAFYNKMNQPAVNGTRVCGAAQTCSLEANTIYNGDIGGGSGFPSVPNRAKWEIKGDIYVRGNFGNAGLGASSVASFEEYKVADGITKRPVVVIEKQFWIILGSVVPNDKGITPIFISYYTQSNPSCSSDPSCSTLTPAQAAQEANNTDSNNHAVRYGTLTGDTYGNFSGSLYSYFGRVSINIWFGGTFTGTVAGQSVLLQGSNNTTSATFNMTNEPWPN